MILPLVKIDLHHTWELSFILRAMRELGHKSAPNVIPSHWIELLWCRTLARRHNPLALRERPLTPVIRFLRFWLVSSEANRVDNVRRGKRPFWNPLGCQESFTSFRNPGPLAPEVKPSRVHGSRCDGLGPFPCEKFCRQKKPRAGDDGPYSFPQEPYKHSRPPSRNVFYLLEHTLSAGVWSAD
jgi:hypothetical protein